MLEEIFYEVDNFCKFFEKKMKNKSIHDSKRRNRKASLSSSEILTILIYFHHSKFKTFKDYYNIWIRGLNKSAFTKLVSYNRFIELSHKNIFTLFSFVSNIKNKCDGISFIDSTPIKVCNNKRIGSNKVFKKRAKRGKSSMGWFFGYKLHFVINGNGEILNFALTPGNISDSNINTVDALTKKLTGKLFGDKGYLSKKIFTRLYAKGITLITKVKKNMKNRLLDFVDKLILMKRGVIESVGNLLKNQCQIEHTRHRSFNGFLLNLFAGVAAYNFRKSKPSIFTEEIDLRLLCR